jgi:hypothetical protein
MLIKQDFVDEEVGLVRFIKWMDYIENQVCLTTKFV